jgi:hypothetical protein
VDSSQIKDKLFQVGLQELQLGLDVSCTAQHLNQALMATVTLFTTRILAACVLMRQADSSRDT